MIRITFAVTLLALSAAPATAAEILIHDDKSAPESLSAAPDGTVFVGSANSPFVYRVRKGASTAEPFVDLSAEGAGRFLGVLVDGPTGTLWTCHLTPGPGRNGGPSNVRAFDLATGAQKLRWALPDAVSNCNDMVVGPDKALYVSDTTNGEIFRLAAGAQKAELLLEHRTLVGVDGVTFLGGALYVNNIWNNNLYRIPIDASGKAGTPVDIWMDAPVNGPDGMRAANGKLFVAEGAGGKLTALTVNGETAHVALVKDGLRLPTGVEPAGDALWFTERATGKVWSIPMPK